MASSKPFISSHYQKPKKTTDHRCLGRPAGFASTIRTSDKNQKYPPDAKSKSTTNQAHRRTNRITHRSSANRIISTQKRSPNANDGSGEKSRKILRRHIHRRRTTYLNRILKHKTGPFASAFGPKSLFKEKTYLVSRYCFKISKSITDEISSNLLKKRIYIGVRV